MSNVTKNLFLYLLVLVYCTTLLLHSWLCVHCPVSSVCHVWTVSFMIGLKFISRTINWYLKFLSWTRCNHSLQFYSRVLPPLGGCNQKKPKKKPEKTSLKFKIFGGVRFFRFFSVFFGFLRHFFGFFQSELRQEIPAIQKSCQE